MIESRFWRKELEAEIKWLRQNQQFKRLTEKRAALFERKLMLIAFQVRSLLDRPKTNAYARNLKIEVSEYKKTNNQPFTLIGPGLPHQYFNLTKPEKTTLSGRDICNQLIHFYWLQLLSESKGVFTSVFFFSDMKRKTCAYEVIVKDLIDYFAYFAKKSSAANELHFYWDENKKDYILHGK